MVFVMLFFLIYIATNIMHAEVVIDIVGESRCPDTTRFFETQLMPVYRKFQSRIKVNYHPYGPTSATYCQRSTNGMRCTCQHGDDECNKNALQACVLRLYPINALETVACIQGRSVFEDAYLLCITPEYSPEESSRIHTCVADSTGFTYMAEYGAKIAAEISDYISWVPWISIEGKRIPEAEYNLEEVLCKKYLRVPECSNYY